MSVKPAAEACGRNRCDRTCSARGISRMTVALSIRDSGRTFRRRTCTRPRAAKSQGRRNPPAEYAEDSAKKSARVFNERGLREVTLVAGAVRDRHVLADLAQVDALATAFGHTAAGLADLACGDIEACDPPGVEAPGPEDVLVAEAEATIEQLVFRPQPCGLTQHFRQAPAGRVVGLNAVPVPEIQEKALLAEHMGIR